jgi:nicotinate-nucleotide adenylyltransferase
VSRIGILGGTFDPPHLAHVAMAQTAKETLGLRTVLLMPALEPPHKTDADVSPYENRVTMARLAAAGREGIEVSRMEELRQGRSYTVDLLREYAEAHDDDLYFILGADSLRDFSSWKDPGGILRMATIVVFPRTDASAYLEVGGEASLVVFEKPVIDVSSNDIRKRYRNGESVGSLVPEQVNTYILNCSLYSR